MGLNVEKTSVSCTTRLQLSEETRTVVSLSQDFSVIRDSGFDSKCPKLRKLASHLPDLYVRYDKKQQKISLHIRINNNYRQ